MNDKGTLGGPAFPAPDFAISQEIANEYSIMRLKNLQGMTLWDYYAAAVLSGTWAGRESDFLAQNEVTCEMVAESAGKLADAMMAERTKREGGGDG